MAMRLCILASGSSGNSALLTTEHARVLIDIGLSPRKLRTLLHEVGSRLEDIDAVFLTHEHGDHAGGLAGLAKWPHIKVFANAATIHALRPRLEHSPAWQVFETGSRFRHRDLEVDAFPVPHDAQDPVGFRFSTGFEDDLLCPRHSLAWLTDLGHVTENVRERVRECETLVIEANHCPVMLKACMKRPWSTKQRISGRHGHLSNEAARDLLDGVASPRWRNVFLTHLSRDCNSPEAVEGALRPLRARLGCEFRVVAPGTSTPVHVLA